MKRREKSNGLVDLIFEICFDSKFPVWEEIFKKKYLL